MDVARLEEWLAEPSHYVTLYYGYKHDSGFVIRWVPGSSEYTASRLLNRETIDSASFTTYQEAENWCHSTNRENA